MSGFLQVIRMKIQLVDAIVMLASELFDLLVVQHDVIRRKIHLIDAIVILVSELFDLLVVQHDVRFHTSHQNEDSACGCYSHACFRTV